MTAGQLAEWEAYDKIEPIGTSKYDWYRTGLLASVITNLVSAIFGKKGSRKSASPEDFVPDWARVDKRVRRQSVEEMKMVMMSFAKVHNASLKKRVPRTTPPRTLRGKRNESRRTGSKPRS